MKPAIYYAFAPGWGDGVGYSLVAVTSEKGGHYYGRDWQEISTHGLKRDLKGRFETKEKALAVIDSLKAIQVKYKPRLEANRRERNTIQQEQVNEETELFKGAP